MTVLPALPTGTMPMLMFGAPPARNINSITEIKHGTPNFMVVPKILTLMLVSIDKVKFELIVRTYNMPVSNDLDQDKIDLLKIARSGRASGGATMVSHDVDGLWFKEPSYFTIVIDNPDWDFYYHPKIPGYDQFRFYTEKESIVGDVLETAQKDGNWSFYDADDREVGGMKAVSCINYCKKKGLEADLDKDETSPFGFNIYLHVPLMPIVGAKRVVVIIDPTGENKGPTGG